MTPRHEQFGHAALYCLVAILFFSYLISFALDVIKTRANRWYALNTQGSPKQSAPWYVRFYEFLNG